MIAIDTNILVYAHREDSPFHAAAYSCVGKLAEGPASWAIPWPCLHEFLAIVTHPRIYAPPTPLARCTRSGRCMAWQIADARAARRNHRHIGRPCARYSPPAASLGRRSMTRGSPPCAGTMVCASLWSADRDFGRFAGLTVVNPLTRDGAH